MAMASWVRKTSVRLKENWNERDRHPPAES